MIRRPWRTSFSLLLFAPLLPLLLAAESGEDRFDPPLDGVYLGIQADLHAPRVRIRQVEAGSAADRAGLVSGDEIVRVGGKEGFSQFEDFVAAVGALHRGDPAPLEIVRANRPQSLTVVPDPAILRDHFRLLALLRESRFLRSREAFPAAMAEFEGKVPAALRSARSSSQGYEILNRALSRLGTSHTSLISPWAYRELVAGEKAGVNEDEAGRSTGLILEISEEGKAFAGAVLDGSPASLAGVQGGDEIVSLNGIPAARSPRLALAGYEAVWRRYALQIDRNETLGLELRRDAGGPTLVVRLVADRPVSGFRATAASFHVLERGGRRIGAIHLWNLLSPELPDYLEKTLLNPKDPSEGLLIDLRGRGGQVDVLAKVIRSFERTERPIVLLQDRETRSAKEILALRLKGRPGVLLVGERSAGAVLPATYQPLPGGAWVLLPSDPGGIDRLTGGQNLEGKGVEPDRVVERAGPYRAGRDPIAEAGLEFLLGLLREVPRRRAL